MSLLWIPLMALCAALLTAVILTAAVLFSPVIFIVDSRNREFRVRWLALIEILIPLPGAASRGRISIAGKSLRFRPGAPQPGRRKAEVAARRERRGGAPLGLVWRCVRNSAIRRGIVRQITKLSQRVLRSFDLVRCQGNVSLPDPAFNGMLAGAIARSGWSRALGVRVNFIGENSLFCEVRFYPYRIVRAFVLFVSGMPYRAIFKEWRATTPLRSQL